MGQIDFNEKYAEWLPDGWYGLDINRSDIIEWLDETFEDLTKIEGFEYHQIKVKYGTVRFYSNLTLNLQNAIESKLQEIYDNQS